VGAGGGNALAAGVASMPFFASLWAKESRYELAIVVADSVSRVACLGLLGAWAMVALGRLMIDLVFTGGRFSADDANLDRQLGCESAGHAPACAQPMDRIVVPGGGAGALERGRRVGA